MNTQTLQYKDLTDFLTKHNAKTEKREGVNIPFTHTRIGDKTMGIHGGSYIIPKEMEETFWNLYYRSVFTNKRMEYLTERQLETGSPILLDFDFRYNYNVDKRQHTKEHIIDIINLVYLEILKEFYVFDVTKPFPIFVFEKPTVNRLADQSLTKDGIHIIIGIKMEHTLQVLLRKKVLDKIGESWDLPIINSWDAVLDEGISKGSTNWQVYGSRKPGNMAYELTQYYVISYDSVDGEFMMEEKNCQTEFTLAENIHKLSARYSEHVEFELTPQMKQHINDTKLQAKPKRVNNTRFRLLISNDPDDSEENNSISLEDIKTPEMLLRAINNLFKDMSLTEYHLKELHDYTQILPEKYYEPGSHLLNTMVAFGLKHTDERLFLSWVMLRSKASDFDYNSIPELYARWKKDLKIRPDGITKRSILYWAKQDAYDDYVKVKNNTIQHFLEETLTTLADYDFAMVLYQMFKDKYICSSVINKTWYVFRNHHWERDLGNSLRLSISREMYNVYQEQQKVYLAQMSAFDAGDERTEQMKKKIQIVTEISIKLKRTNEKSNIFKEAAEIFYDEEFVKKMDENRYLLCFTNGVVDLKNKLFRDGYPQDYITKTTGIPYSPFDMEKHESIANKIMTFMEQLFPIPTLNRYMWDHLASVLIGENINQTFNIYRGNGSNGKSLLTDLMALTLGEYAGTVPITLVTEKRVGVGGTSSEVMQLKGVRYAVMQEPSKDAKINEGMMKQLTGDSSMTARALYCESEKFSIQFHLVVCTNTLFEIVSNDDGTWRRIRIVEFMSKFVNPEDPKDDTEHQFDKDPILKEKLPSWAPVFASMLVKRAFENQGIVENCDIVMSASNKYRQGQDHIAGFVAEMVMRKEGKKIGKRELCEQFKVWFQEQQGNRKAPKGVELCEYMDKKFGACKKKDGWQNVQIVYPEQENDNEVDDLY
uniref:SF3 helicase domain-containing protein n=1 Tax=viral metagenome TaxID=1070528 RepID=A0A6C0AZW8_9ZZZZ